jgi:pyruvate,water dikinase
MNLELEFCYPLEGHGSDSTEVGGKAASLDRLIAAGFPVPQATVVTSRAYRAFIRSTGLDEYLDELMKADLPGPSEQMAQAREVESRFLAAPMPGRLQAEIEASLEHLLTTSPLAVRSSATAEDMVTASFAGQYDSFLGIKTISEGLTAVRRCWASLWSPQSRAYRRREHIDEQGIAMAVILQHMVEADWSGVLFTRDPQGSPTDMRIEAVAGPGDLLVSGKLTPRAYSVDRQTLRVRSRDGSADLSFLEDLARLALRVEHNAGSPQDIEWAATHGRIRLVQARPITVTKPLASHNDGFDTMVRSGDVFTPRGVAEMLPGVIPPLLWSINGPMLEDAFRRFLVRLGAGEQIEGRSLVGRFRGRAALNLSALREAAIALGSSASEVEQQYLGRSISGDEAGAKRGSLRAAFRSWLQDRRLTDEVTLVKLAVEGIVQLDLDLERLPVSQLLAYRHRLRDLAWRIYAAEVASSSAAAGAYRNLELQLAKWLDDMGEGSRWAQRLTAGTLSDASVGAGRINRLRDVYERFASVHPAIEEAISADPERSTDRLRALGRPGREFIKSVDRCVRSFGAQAVYGGKAWSEDLPGIWSQLAAFRKDATGEPVEQQDALTELHHRLAGLKGWRLTRFLTGQVIDTRLRLLDRMVREATTQLRNREDAKQALLVLGGEERRLINEATDRLMASGHIQAREEIEWFSDDEIEQMLHGAAPVFSQEIARRRRALERARHAGHLPETFSGDPDISIAVAHGDEAMLEGWAASPGRVEGRARVLRHLAEGDALQSGEIIVAHSTDPSWTPLFLVAGGIVLEEGGPLSHAAIVAREFGLPAVLNVPQATSLIETGESLLVDGTDGTVTRIDRGGR